MELDCIVENGIVVTAADQGRYDIGIKDGLISILAPSSTLKSLAKCSRIIDAQGAYVMVS